MRFAAGEAAAAIGAELVGPDTVVDGATFDSREVHPGQLFVPLVAARDGHEFVAAALARGAAAYLTEREPQGATAIRVPDTAAALLALASWGRDRLPDSVVAVTGSVGKTSTKDFVAAVARARLRTAAAERSFNNEQGLPVTILNAPDDVEVVVLEMGMRGPGEIARLCRVGRPTIGVVTGVGEAHTERLGGLAGVARAKGELVEALPAAGTAVLNADDPWVLPMAERSAAPVLTYGSGVAADVRIENLQLDALARSSFRCRTPWGVAEVHLRVPGAHMAANAAAALAAAGVLGVPIDVAADALASAAISGMRMEMRATSSGATVVDDSYNANPTSVLAALDTLAAMHANRRVAVLGLMAELDQPAEQHRAVAARAAELGVQVVAVGTDLYGIAGIDTDGVPGALGSLGRGDAVLVKGSRVAGLERVVRLLVEEGAAGHPS